MLSGLWASGAYALGVWLTMQCPDRKAAENMFRGSLVGMGIGAVIVGALMLMGW
jgi:hypothetical protein